MEEEQNGNLIKKFTLAHGCQPSCCQPGRIWDGAGSVFRSSISNTYAAPGAYARPFVSRDLERCSIQTFHHIVEHHPPQRDQHTIVLDSRVCCKENWRCSCPSRYLCTGEMGEEPTSWWPGEWTVFHQYFQQRTDNLNVQQISIKLSHWVFSGLNLKWPLTAHALNAFSLAGANKEAVEPYRGGSWLAEVGNKKPLRVIPTPHSSLALSVSCLPEAWSSHHWGTDPVIAHLCAAFSTMADHDSPKLWAQRNASFLKLLLSQWWEK